MKRHQFILPNDSRRGFVLVLTLAMILIAVMISARTAHRSLSRTLQSLEAESALRSRWEELSLQRSLLSRAGAIFEQVSTQPGTVSLDGRFQLSGHEYRVRVSDENAKLNLNRLRQLWTPEESQSAIREFTESLPDTSLPTPPLESWGQLFSGKQPRDLMTATTSITLWGDGRLNLQRASEDSIRHLLIPVIGSSEVDALLRTRRERIGQRLQSRDLSIPTHARNLLTDESRCYSLWIMEPESGAVRLDVREGRDRASVVTSFRW